MAFLPTDIANQSLDAIGSEIVLGDIQDGTREAQVCLRAYRQCLQDLLRAAHWQFARKQTPLLLLGDATGQTVGVGTAVMRPWVYCYAYPVDCVRMIYVPQGRLNAGEPQGNYAIPDTPLTTGGVPTSALIGHRLQPSPFLIARDVNYPPVQGQIWWEVQGESPQGRTVVCSNVQQAIGVYTSMVLYPSEWDGLFRRAMIAYLAQAIALPISRDKKLGMSLRAEQIKIAKMAITEARIADGNETVSSTDHLPDWLRTRNVGGAWGGYRNTWGGWWGSGCYNGWNECGFADGSVY